MEGDHGWEAVGSETMDRRARAKAIGTGKDKGKGNNKAAKQERQ